MKTLKSVVDERMIEVEKQVRQDYKAAMAQMSEVEKRGPDAVKRLSQLVAEIELQREEKRLESLEKLLTVLAGATGEVKEVLSELAVKNFEKGQDSAYKSIGERLDLLGFNLFGQKWVDQVVKDTIQQHYGHLKEKGNGHG